nr:PEPxxWA-CTERM sorting domain-containing protein [Sphingomonas sp.]
MPEPATWAMFIGGFGLVGATMRRRRPTVRFAYRNARRSKSSQK